MSLIRWKAPESSSAIDVSRPHLKSAMKSSVAIAEKFESVVGPENIRPATAADSIAGVQPEYVVSPATEQELAAVLVAANEAEIAVIPRGGGTKLDWGNAPARAGIVLSTLRLNRIIEHPWADLTVSVEAGCTMQHLQNTVARHGQRLALDALWPERATVGGVLSSNDSGVLRLRFGALRDLIIGVTLALPDGTLASSGGKVVKNVAGYDLPKLATGALGTLGVITRAIFRLHPLPRTASTITCVTSSISDAKNLIARLLDSTLAYSALQVRFLPDRSVTANNPDIFVDILFEGTEAGIAAQIAQTKVLAEGNSVTEVNHAVWQAREKLHVDAVKNHDTTALIKISLLPTDAILAIGNLSTMSNSRTTFDAVVQATGLGTVLLKGDAAEVTSILSVFRKRTEEAGGSMVILGRSESARTLDAWGNPSDAIGVMRALKQQLDPKSTLNTGRFVGGI